MNLDKVIDEVGYLIKEVQKEVRKRLQKPLMDIGLTAPQYSALNQLRVSPGLSNADLARKDLVTPQTMNLIIRNLEERNLVVRNGSKTNGTILNTEITKEGLELLDKAQEMVRNVQREVFGRISEEEAMSLTFILRKLRYDS